MYSFDDPSSSLGSISSALALPVPRGRHRKLVESDVTSLLDPFTSRPYTTPFYFYYCVPHKIPRGILFQIHAEYSPSSRLLVSALTVYATAFRPMFPSCSLVTTHILSLSLSLSPSSVSLALALALPHHPPHLVLSRSLFLALS